MKKSYLFLLLFLFGIKMASAQKITEEQLQALHNSVKSGKDPYFIESRDTFSKNGPDCITRDLLQDKMGNIWMATWKGIIQYNGTIFTNFTLKDGLIPFHVISCYGDKKGNLWFGTARGGVYCYDGKSFKLFTTKDGLPNNNILCIAEDLKGSIWFATDSGASRFDGRVFTNFTVKDALPSNKVSAVIADRKGNLWIGCSASAYQAADGGLVLYDGETFSNFSCKGRESFTTVSSLFEDKNGNLWIGRMDGLSIYDGKSVVDLEVNLSYYIIEDKEGNVWLTITDPPGGFHPETPNQMLCRYNGKKLTKILEKFKPGDCQVFGKIEYRNGNIWFGTMRGICRYDGENFKYFTD